MKDQGQKSALTPTKPTEYEEYVRVQTRRELVWSLDRRGIRPTQIQEILAKQDLLNGITDPYQTIRKDRALGLKVARGLRDAGDMEQAEAEYLGRLTELFRIAVGNGDLSVARNLLHDWAFAHGLKPTEPLSPVLINQNNLTLVKIDGSDPEALRKRLGEITLEATGISEEIRQLAGGNGADKNSSRKEEQG